MMNPLAALLVNLLGFYVWVVIAAVIMSWLIAFHVINLNNQFARSVVRVLDALTEPVFRQVRRVIPPMGGLDLSPIVVLFAIWFIQYSIGWASLRYGF